MPSLAEPDGIGRYKNLERIGRGAMGTVYRAYDPQIGRTVAIKVLLSDDEELRARFGQEVRTAGTLSHQNIVTVYDFGETDGRPYIVMEYVDGRTLADLMLEGKPFPLSDKIRLMQQLCAALDYAHGRGVIHRDIKPANLMLDRHGDLKVVDFGIAKLGDVQLTRTGDVLGTLTYMSPEQVDHGVVDRRSDIFSVGSVLYELVSSQRAFQGETPSQVMRAILNEQPVALTRVVPHLDPALDRIVRTAMHKDPAQRYQTLAQLAADLARIRTTAAHDVSPDAPTGTLLVDRNGGTNQVAAIAAAAGSQSASHAAGPAARRWLVAGWVSALGIAIGAIVWLAVIAFTKPTTADLPIEHATTSARGTSGPTTPDISTIPAATSVAPTGADAGPSQRVTPGDSGPPRSVGAGTVTRGAVVGSNSTLPPKKVATIEKPVAVPTPYDKAKAIMSANPTDEDRSKALNLFRVACDGGENQACFEAGVIYRDTSALRNLPMAVQLFQRACDGDIRQACNYLGQEYARGLGVAKDEVKAASLFKRACDADGPIGCSNLARAYQQGLGVPRDDAAARSLYERACDLGNTSGCADLGILLQRGIGGPPDAPRAVTMFQRACDGGSTLGCGSLGFAYARGNGVARDDVRAVTLYQRACDAGGAPSCNNLATMYTVGRGVEKDLAHAAVLLERSCQGNFADGCETLSQRYDKGVGVERDPARATELMRRATQLRRAQNPNAGGTTPVATGSAGSAVGGVGGGVIGGVVGGVVGGLPAAPPPPPPPPAAAPVRVGGTIKAPAKTKHVNPVYPPVAQSSRIQGVVILEAVIGPDGRVTGAKVLKSIPLLDQAALDAVKQWEFTPTVVNGVAVPVIMTTTVTFSLN